MYAGDKASLVVKYLSNENYKNLTDEEIAAICKVSVTTVKCIRAEYLNAENSESNVTTAIPYDELKRLITCETVVTELLEASIQSDGNPDELFLPRGMYNRTLRRLLPEEYRARLERAQQEAVNLTTSYKE